MSRLEDFETTLKDVVNAKRLSASKMTKLTDIALKSVEHDTKLVAILYRTHKSLSSTAKVSSLYAFDALARAARSYATKRGITGDINSSTGNAATFLLKVEGVLDGLFQDMIALDNAEAKEKTKKVLDIWTKSNTFPSPVLTRLREMMDSRKESVKIPPIARVETQTLPIITTPPSVTPSQGPTPPLPESVQSTLLALLKQTAQAAGQPPIQTPPNIVPAPPLAGHLALLQQLALTANVPNGGPPSQSTIQLPLRNTQLPSAPQRPPPPPLSNQPQPYSSSQSHVQRDPGRDSWQSRSSQFDHGRERNGFQDLNSRGGFQRGFRGRGRGRGRWDDRDHDHFKDRDWNSSPRPRNSRSRSPRRFNGQRPRPYSPPQRPAASRDVVQNQTAKLPEAGKDEFGRDIRPSSATPPRAASVDAQAQPPMVPSVVLARTAASENRVPVSDQLPSVAASTSTVEPRKPSSAPALQQLGLDHFDITTFDFTAPSSWEALGKMWHSTYGDTPSQEELMQFVMTGGVVAFTGQTNAVQAGQWGAQSAGSGRGWQEDRGRGRGLMAGRGDTLGHGKYRDDGHWDDAQHSDAIVLGEASGQDSGHGGEQAQCMDLAQTGRDDLLDVDDSQNVASGRMEQVGDKQVFMQELGHETEA
ncbi:hypothetical protein BDR04DRAFT_1091302 [Suillus decipiens]|nr:hypothetical protein BDR04DRAFT_1091302 [Suillus decipiens]